LNQLTKGIWDAIKNGPFIPMIENEKGIYEKPWSRNGLSKKVKRHNMIVLLRTLSYLH